MSADLYLPDFVALNHTEMHVLYVVIRYALCTHIYTLILMHSVFETGEFLGGYARLMALSTPDLKNPQKRGGGRNLYAPTYEQIRKAVQLLIDYHLVRRGSKNEEQGQLRLFVRPRKDPIKKPDRPKK